MIFLFTAHAAAGARLVVIAPHPDDGEASCGGLIANTVAAGGEVVILTMTGGEVGIIGKTPEQARAVRRAEAEEGSAALGAQVEFFGGFDGAFDASAENAEKLIQTLLRLDPEVVTAPWPLDIHPDHQASGMLAWRVFHDKRFSFDLFFYETANLPYTKSFQFVPTHYVDITDVLKLKQKALYKHTSQMPAMWFDQYKAIETVRGYECDAQYAEGYVKAGNFSAHGGRPGRPAKTLGEPEGGAK